MFIKRHKCYILTSKDLAKIDMFTATNQPTNRNTRIVSESEQIAIEYLLSLNFGFNKISKVVGVSTTKLYAMGYRPTNQKDTLKRIKKSSKVNPSIIEAEADGSDISTRSKTDANKNKRTLEFLVNGQKFRIKFYVCTDGHKTIYRFFKSVSGGEKKAHWAELLKDTLAENWRIIGIDTQCKFKDSPKKLVHPIKDYEHPYNQKAESKIGQFKKRVYANIETIKGLTIDEAIKFLTNLAEIQFNNNLALAELNNQEAIQIKN